MLLPHPSLSGELSHTLQETDLGICGREQENGCLMALMPDSFHVAKLFAAFCSPTLPFSLSCQRRGENWVALPSFCPWLVPEKGDFLRMHCGMIADLQLLLFLPKGQKWGVQREEEYCLRANPVLSTTTQRSSSQLYPALSCLLLRRGEHLPRRLSAIVMSITPGPNL